MITGVELDFVVKDCLAALPLYGRIFEVDRIEATSLERGQNEAVFALYGTRFHMLDENPHFQLFAPREGAQPSIWFNIAVPDIEGVYNKAMDEGCREIQPITDMPGFGARSAMFSDPFGHVWMLHQIERQVPFEERMQQHPQAVTENE